MAQNLQIPKRAKAKKAYRTGSQKTSLHFASKIRDAGTVIREHVKAGFDIPADCRNAIFAADNAINTAMSLLGNVKVVPPAAKPE